MSIHDRSPHAKKAQAGLSLIELIIFIVIVGVGVAGILSLMNVTTRASADPLQRKQALAIAEALLEEVSQMPFTTCDPDGFIDETTCNQAEGMGPEGGEIRGGLATPFDNVNDYHGFVLGPGGGDIGNSPGVVVPAGYQASVAVVPSATFGPAGMVLPAVDVLRIAVTVNFNNGADNIVLECYRTRFAPNGMP